jgi:DNA-binding MarR family transcriptional regulator
MATAPNEDSDLLIPDDIVAYYVGAEPGVYDALGSRTFFLIRALAQRLNDVSSSWLEPFGLTSLSFNVLAFLRARPAGAFSLSSISKSLHTRPATVTSLIDTLERDGLVARVAHRSDRRTTLAVLTPQGAKLIERASLAHHAHINATLEGIGTREREMLMRLLLRANDGLMREKSRLKEERQAS